MVHSGMQTKTSSGILRAPARMQLYSYRYMCTQLYSISEKRALLYEKEDAPAVESAFVFTASDGRRRAAPRSLGNQRETVRPTPALAGPLVRNLLGRGRGGWEGMWGGVGLAEVCIYPMYLAAAWATHISVSGVVGAILRFQGILLTDRSDLSTCVDRIFNKSTALLNNPRAGREDDDQTGNVPLGED